MYIIPPWMIESERRERERREREAEEGRRLPLYLPVPPEREPERKNEVDYVVEF